MTFESSIKNTEKSYAPIVPPLINQNHSPVEDTPKIRFQLPFMVAFKMEEGIPLGNQLYSFFINLEKLHSSTLKYWCPENRLSK
jgi:hypothetical protein